MLDLSSQAPRRLCATATVVGTSAVGLSFGRETPTDSSHSSEKRAAPARDLAANSMPTAVQTTAMAATAPSFSAPTPVAPASRVPIASRPTQDARSQARIVRRMTSEDVTALRSPNAVNGYAPSEQSTSDADTARHPSTRRASWIKRLSSISNSSSRNTSPAPLSPAVSCSNGSMAFSQDGSTAPMFGRRSASPMPPNKLVKRSSSVRGPREAYNQGAAALRPSFRRPATSHQRTATLQARQNLANESSTRLQRTVEDPASEGSAYAASTDSEAEYAQFFTTKITRERTLAKKRGSAALVGGFKRIFPDDKHLPTLVLAKSVRAGVPELDDSTTEDSGSVYLVSRPETPLSITVFGTKESLPTRGRPSADQPGHASRPKRSFSITEFLSSSKRQLAARASSRPALLRRASQRVQSAPVLTTMNRRPHSTCYGGSRREMTEPALVPRRDIATSAGPADVGCARNGLQGGSSSTPLPTLPARRASADTVPVEGLASMPQQLHGASAAPGANQAPPSPTLAQSGVRASRHSMAPSEQGSTLVGSSDNELRGLGSGDEDDADVQSETLYDSLHTAATRSTTGGARGARIETIFDESPPSKVKVTALRDLFPPGSFGDHPINGVAGHQSIAEEEESIATPVRTVRPERSLQESPNYTRTYSAPLFPNTVSVSPPSMPKPLSLGTLEWDSRPGNDDDSSRWSLEDADAEDPWVDPPTVNRTTATVSLLPQNARHLASGPTSKPTTPQHLTAEHGDRDTRSSIFDWSEQQVADKNSGSCTPPRPRTVHGKKDADRRGSRSVGRRVPSGLHARSQSVPVVPDLTGKRNTVVTNKFGTWGVGSKGVTEDWNDDFDFTELNEDPIEEGDASPRVDSGTSMVVPKSIREQQNNVLANIGLLREWGLLIEELKEHRVRALALGIIEGSQSSMWEEVDAMIDLADQEADHQCVGDGSPPSSPGFDEAFDEPPASPSQGRGRRTSGTPDCDIKKSPIPSPHPRKSILPPNHDIFTPQSSPIPPKSVFDVEPATQDAKAIVTRPRKDSEAKARSVIEALQKRRSTHEPILDTPPTPSSKKVPFDTATLRRIVPYVSSLTRKVKDTIRDAEGLYSSPIASPMHEEPPINKVFQQDADLAAQMKLMTVM
ncbi:hypothetical protein DDE82_000794 [Stemphylium lycopersici]|uniref:Uncharacterized protein n=1 Tax=Stemphylium lycopersici TaxID=183478 RepID=A0A364N007_STELY|nr:hypothetical protein DDE83_005993 [Stemphylium lycopersici]RAR11317.1 hypothetical protein DDE82_000794 [Stemphylium lycopersici]